jgi:hypothetical protein
MKRVLAAIVISAFVASTASFAQAPATAPAGSTGLCKDGSFTSNATKKGACAGHKGVKEWFAAAAPATEATNPSANATPPKASSSRSAKTSPSKTEEPSSGSPSAAAAPGGGAGKVWVNTESKVYHCVGTRYYGKTKQGEYMTEAQAKAAGARADHGKPCS